MPGDRTRIAWRSAGVPATALLETLSAQLAQAGFSEVFACETDRCGGFDFRLAQPVLPMPGMFVNLGDFRYLAVERKTPPAQASVLVSQTPGGAYAQLSVTLPASASPVAAAPGGQAMVAAPVAAARLAGAAGGARAAAALFVTDPAGPATLPAPALLADAFGLTATEAEVARLVAQGRGMPFVAESLGVSLNTARTHLKSVYDKTGLNHQSALARAIASRFPALRGLNGG
jgi:OOP family OmpA-OmpF porin